MSTGLDRSTGSAESPGGPGAGRHAPLRVLRWLLVVPAGFLGWQLGLAGGLLMFGVAESFCPPAAMVSGACTAPWWPTAEGLAIHAGAGLAAALVVLLPVLCAPSMRGTVAWSAWGVGLGVAGHLAWMTDAWTELAVAAAVGFAVLLAALRRWRGDGRGTSVRPQAETGP